MTLRHQLIIIFTLLLLCVFGGSLAISVNNTRAYLGEQLQSHAQDTATSLGLSLTPALANNDLTLAETMVNAIFDPGYYREITVRAADGTPLIERVLPVRIEGVPAWFVNLIALDTPQRESEVMSGWRRAAKVVVRSHPGYAYQELWRIAVQSFWWFLVVTIGAVAVIVAALRYVLAPLRALERQALAIAEREFPVLAKLPWTRELRRVVVAMNTMSGKVERMLNDQTELTEKMREQAYRDPVTGLANRRSFEDRLHHLVESHEEFQHGALVLVQLDALAVYNERHGYAAGDELLRQTAELLSRALAETGECVAARLGGGTFGVLAHDVLPHEAAALGETIGRALRELHTRGLLEAPGAGHIGIAYHDGRLPAAQLLAQADMALRAAQAAGPNAWRLYESAALAPAEVQGAGQWKTTLLDLIDARKLVLHFQPVVTCADRAVSHYEVLARLPRADGELMPAGVFLPMAERAGLSDAFDRLVVESVLAFIAAHPATTEKYAVNLCPRSVHDARFVDWLCAVLERTPAAARRLILEVREFGALAQPEALRAMVARVRALGAQVSLDRFGVGFGSFGYLKSLKIDYIKLDGSFIRRLDQNRDNQFFVLALGEIAHGLDVQVIAESVETEAEWAILPELHVDGAQGYFVGRPGPRD